MKILIVDDESTKLKRLMHSFKNIDGLQQEDIIHVLELSAAKKHLIESEFDLMILDLNLPEVLGEDPIESAGTDFIDEIMYVERYNKPREIIILTAYDNLEENFNKIQNKFAFQVLRYDESNNTWADKIRSRIEYILLYETSKRVDEFSLDCDVAIITAVRIETEAVKKLSREWNRVNIKGDPTFYFSTNFNGKSGDIKVITAQQSEMGMAAASLLTTKLIFNFKPKHIIMVGIAAGIDKENNFGDIIIPNEVWVYSNGKYIHSDSDSLIQFKPDPKSIPLNPEIRELVSQDFGETLFQIKRDCEVSPSYELNVINGPMACGSAVVANSEIIDNLVTNHSRKTIGLDMESYGVFYAAQNFNNQKTIPIIVKSICDFADSEKGDNYQNYAANTSAKFAKFLIEKELQYN